MKLSIIRSKRKLFYTLLCSLSLLPLLILNFKQVSLFISDYTALMYANTETDEVIIDYLGLTLEQDRTGPLYTFNNNQMKQHRRHFTNSSRKPNVVLIWDIITESILIHEHGQFSAHVAANVPMGERIMMASFIRGLTDLGYLYLLVNSKQMFHRYYQHFAKDFVWAFSNVYHMHEANGDPNDFFGAVEGGRRRFMIIDTWGSMRGVKDDVMVPGFEHYQYVTQYPDQFVNTFLGFIVDPCPTPLKEVVKEQSDLVWAKNSQYFTDMYARNRKVYSVLKKSYPQLTLYGTVNSDQNVPPEIKNLKPMARIDFIKKLASQQFFMGIGSPHDGPSALEALSCGVPYINTVYDEYTGDIHERRVRILNNTRSGVMSKDEGSRELFKRTSQHKFTETFTEPYVYHVRRNDNKGMIDGVGRILKRSKEQPPLEPFIPKEFQYEEYMKRFKAMMERNWKQ